MTTQQSGEPATGAYWLAFAAQHRNLRAELEDVLFHQAALLDEDKLEQWLDMLADDLRYVAPVRIKVRPEPTGYEGPRVCHFNDTKMELSLRVGRIRTGFAHYNNLQALTRHMVGNVRIVDVQDGARIVKVASNFSVFRAREEKEETTFSGGRTDLWRRSDGQGWQLVHRLILLDHHIVPPISVLF